jgi:hypothetical protein
VRRVARCSDAQHPAGARRVAAPMVVRGGSSLTIGNRPPRLDQRQRTIIE